MGDQKTVQYLIVEKYFENIHIDIQSDGLSFFREFHRYKFFEGVSGNWYSIRLHVFS